MTELPALFPCSRRDLRLTTGACAKLWLSANGSAKPQSWEGRAACVGCFVGAGNAGQPIERTAEAAVEWRDICPRCLRPASRLIHGEHCVSCYNRAREAASGRNRKGNVPALANQLHDERVLVLQAPQAPVVTAGHVVDASELMVRAVKGAAHAMTFTRPVPAFAGAYDEQASWDEVCPRCCGTDGRLIRDDLCVSCYNRDREAAIGRDRKGHRPRLVDALGPRAVVVTAGENVRLVEDARATGAGELMLRSAKTAGDGPLIFTAPAPVFLESGAAL